jgi:ParB family chromosome partitioning protein
LLAARKYRIVQQIIENDQRAELSVADRTAAWAQLAFEGVSAAAIAKRTGTKTDAV